MRRVTMPDLRIGDLVVPGGWQAWLPEYTVDEDFLKVMTQAVGSRERAREILEKPPFIEYRTRFGKAILRRAVEYAEHYPDLVERRGKYRVLKGFDPELLVGAYVPYDSPGKHPKEFVRALLFEMAQKARQLSRKEDT